MYTPGRHSPGQTAPPPGRHPPGQTPFLLQQTLLILLEFLLPPANEVWGKVIFSEACVKNSVHGGSAWADTPLGPGTPHQTMYTPQDQVHPLQDQAGTPSPGPGTPPGTRQVPLDQAGPPGTRQVCPQDQAGTPPRTSQVHPPDQVHPQTRQVKPPWDQAGTTQTRPPPPSCACWEIRATSRRYSRKFRNSDYLIQFNPSHI